MLLLEDERKRAQAAIIDGHYSHSVPSGKTHYLGIDDALFAFAISANRNIGPFILGNGSPVWELSRMWAPENHEATLTAALARAVSGFRVVEPGVVALVSFADPNQGHEGGVYRAASWHYTGRSAEGRYYIGSDGQVVSRRKFHSGSKGLTKAEIEAKGYTQLRLPGKHRFAKGLTKASRSIIRNRFAE